MTKKPYLSSMDVVDLILVDHKILKECIEVLSSEKHDKKKKLASGRTFLEVLKKHSLAEKKTVYTPLEKNDELHFLILEGEVEHGIVDQKVRLLKRRIANSRSLSDENEAEFKVLAELVKHHVKEEENEMLPKIREEIDDETLTEMGHAFMKARKFESGELVGSPELYDELVQWKDSVQKISAQFLSRMDKYMENMKH